MRTGRRTFFVDQSILSDGGNPEVLAIRGEDNMGLEPFLITAQSWSG
jgi:hypothetical protein